MQIALVMGSSRGIGKLIATLLSPGMQWVNAQRIEAAGGLNI